MLAITFGQTWWIWLILAVVMVGIALKKFFGTFGLFFSSGPKDVKEPSSEPEDDENLFPSFFRNVFKNVGVYFAFMMLGGLFFLITIIAVLFRLFG